MDLNKDNRDVYTIDSESYSEYMEETRKKPRNLLGTIIQFLIVILLLVLVYFFFNILKNDLSFSEVFNKKELLATYESLVGSQNEIQIETEENSKVLVKEIAPKPKIQQTISEKITSEEPTPHKIAVVTEQKVIENIALEEKAKPVIKSIEKVEKEEPSKIAVTSIKVESIPIEKENREDKIVTEEKVVVVKEVPKPLKTIEKVEVKKIVKVEAKPVEVVENAEVAEESELTDSYLDRMVAELNSI